MQLGTIVYILYLLIGAYVCLIAARVLVSWLRPRPGSSIYRLYWVLCMLTEPYLRLFRRLLPILSFGRFRLDLSPAVGLIILVIVLEMLGGLS